MPIPTDILPDTRTSTSAGRLRLYCSQSDTRSQGRRQIRARARHRHRPEPHARTHRRRQAHTPDNTPLRERSDTANRGPLPSRNRQVIHSTPRCRRHLLLCRRRTCRTKDGRRSRRSLIDRGERRIPRAVCHPRRTCTRASRPCYQCLGTVVNTSTPVQSVTDCKTTHINPCVDNRCAATVTPN